MIIIRNLKIPLLADFSNAKDVLERKAGISVGKKTEVKLYKKAVDARDKNDICFNCAFTLSGDDEGLLKALYRFHPETFMQNKYKWDIAAKGRKIPVIIGFGPAGMFAALSLARAGLNPVVLEQGKSVDERRRDVDGFFAGGKLNTLSNIQFGEGGAGTFSDGKLNTGIKDPRIRAVLEVFAEHGAGHSILTDAKPHIGTDVLTGVVKSIRNEIILLGGKVLFEHRVTEIKTSGKVVTGVVAETPEGAAEFSTDSVILAPGHSARDTFIMLKRLGVNMEPKPFAIGLRIEHLQSDINRSQYGRFAENKALGAADYRLAEHLLGGRGVFTFCMCPGGEVVNASSEEGGITVNGMSNSERNGRNANSAVLVGVEVEDFYRSDVLDGMYFQREIERKAYEVGKGLPVCQTVGDFLGISAKSTGRVTPSIRTGVTFAPVNKVLPEFVTEALKGGIKAFDRRLHGFASPDAILTAPETRSSSPVRILRNTDGVSSVTGLYPCGEGAGYAGGITSAAVDGLKAAENIIGIGK